MLGFGPFHLDMGGAGKAVSKEHLLERLYNWDGEVGSNAIEVSVHCQRKKLDGCGMAIHNVRGLGHLPDQQRTE